MVSAGDVLAGEIISTPLLVTRSSTFSVTDDEAAPMRTSTFFGSKRLTVCVAVLVDESPESPSSRTTFLKPGTPPAALMSLIASLTASTSGGPRNASEPVTGRSVPTVKTPSLAPFCGFPSIGLASPSGVMVPLLNWTVSTSLLSGPNWYTPMVADVGSPASQNWMSPDLPL